MPREIEGVGEVELEEVLADLDDVLWGRGQRGSREEGRQTLRRRTPALTEVQIEAILDRWMVEVTEGSGLTSWWEE